MASFIKISFTVKAEYMSNSIRCTVVYKYNNMLICVNYHYFTKCWKVKFPPLFNLRCHKNTPSTTCRFAMIEINGFGRAFNWRMIPKIYGEMVGNNKKTLIYLKTDRRFGVPGMYIIEYTSQLQGRISLRFTQTFLQMVIFFNNF